MMHKKLLIIFFFIGFAFAQQGPSIFVKETNHNFGDVKEGKFVTHKYIIENKGNEDLVIKKVKASCGCTAATPEKSTLKPGEKTSVYVEFNTVRRQGAQTKFVYVFSNDPKRPQIRLSFTANIQKKSLEEMQNESVALLKIQKNYFDLGKVKQGSKKEIKVPIQNIGKEKLKIRSISSTCSCLTSEPEKKYLEPGEKSFITLSLDTKDYIGKMSRTMTVITNDPYNTYQAISVYVNITK